MSEAAMSDVVDSAPPQENTDAERQEVSGNSDPIKMESKNSPTDNANDLKTPPSDATTATRIEKAHGPSENDANILKVESEAKDTPEEKSNEDDKKGPRRRKRRRQNKSNIKMIKKAANQEKAEFEAKKAEEEQAAKKAKLGASEKAAEVVASIMKAKHKRGTLSDWLNPGHRFYDDRLKQAWKQTPKKTREVLIKADKERCAAMMLKVEHTFSTETDDHCETAPEAYSDIVDILKALAKELGKEPKDLAIYDPYYCSGAVERHLNGLGFKNVYNKNEDFYKVEEEGKIPEHDVVVTNPPYSSDHVERLLKFIKGNEKPSFLLMPNYVCTKPTFEPDAFSYVVPFKRYVYWTPKGLRPKEGAITHTSTLGIRTSPFISFWYITKVSKELLDGAKQSVFHDLDSLPRSVNPNA